MSQAPTAEQPEAPAAEPRAPFVLFRADGTRVAASEKIAIEPVNFHNPTLLAESELRRLRLVHDDFTRTLAARLSSLLRAELGLHLGSFETKSCEAFIEGLRNPNQIALFRVTPLNGIGLIEFPPKLAAALTNRILGGREPAENAAAYLTEIEIALLEDVIAIITTEWCEQWHDETNMTAHLIGHETNPRFIQMASKGAMMLVVGIEVALGRCEEVIQIAVPLSMIEPMMKRMDAARTRDSQRSEQGSAWRASYDEITVPVHAEMVAAKMTVAALLRLKTGDLIELPASALENTRISVAGSVRFTARAGQQNGFAAVEIAGKTSTT